MTIMKKRLYVGGMTCVHCQQRIEKQLLRRKGVKEAKVNYVRGTVDLTYDSDVISLKQMQQEIENAGYQVLASRERAGAARAAGTLTVILALYVLLQRLGILNYLVPGQLAENSMGYGMLFLIGLTTSVHCIAMCGGIHLSQCLPPREDRAFGERFLFFPAVLYNLGRVVSYTAVGFAFGLVSWMVGGENGAGVPGFWQGLLKIIAGLFMVIAGINLLGLFPWLRGFTFRMPAAAGKRVERERRKSRRPFVIGFLNGFLPCGPLQAMWLVAFAAGNPISGALSMLCFALGTVPLMLGLGSAVLALGRRFSTAVRKAGAVLVTVMGLAMLSQGISLGGWMLPAEAALLSDYSAADLSEAVTEDGVQVVESTLSYGSYPSISVQAGVPVKWIITAPEGSINGCNYRMWIPEYNLEYSFQTGENVIEFTPKETGSFQYTCWMGMIRGKIVVTEAPESENQEEGFLKYELSEEETAESELSEWEVLLPPCCR